MMFLEWQSYQISGHTISLSRCPTKATAEKWLNPHLPTAALLISLLSKSLLWYTKSIDCYAKLLYNHWVLCCYACGFIMEVMHKLVFLVFGQIWQMIAFYQIVKIKILADMMLNNTCTVSLASFPVPHMKPVAFIQTKIYKMEKITWCFI